MVLFNTWGFMSVHLHLWVKTHKTVCVGRLGFEIMLGFKAVCRLRVSQRVSYSDVAEKCSRGSSLASGSESPGKPLHITAEMSWGKIMAAPPEDRCSQSRVQCELHDIVNRNGCSKLHNGLSHVYENPDLMFRPNIHNKKKLQNVFIFEYSLFFSCFPLKIATSSIIWL